MRRRTRTSVAALATDGLAIQQGAMTMNAQEGSKPAAQPPHRSSQFFHDEDMNYTFLGMLGSAYERLADVGAVLAIADQITDGDAASAYTAFTAAGDRLAGIAEAALTAGRKVSAREAYLQASN